MNLSGYGAEPRLSLWFVAPARHVAPIRFRSDVAPRDCSSPLHRVSSLRAIPLSRRPETPSGPSMSDWASPPMRHANCSRANSSNARDSFEVNSCEIQPEGFGAIAHRRTPSVHRGPGDLKPGPKNLSNRSGVRFTGFGSIRGIVQKPTRRDSTCVPQ
jgi:hypothetical protein